MLLNIRPKRKDLPDREISRAAARPNAGVFTEIVLLAGSRDSLSRYYDRVKILLGEVPSDSDSDTFD